jgi:WD40 repeat protein
MDTGREIANVRHEGAITSIGFSADSRLVATGSGGVARAIEVGTGKELARIQHNGSVDQVRLSSDGQILASKSWDDVVVFDLRSGDEITRLDDDYDGSLSISPDARFFAVARISGEVRLLRADAEHEEIARLDGFTESWRAMAFSPDSSLFAVAFGGVEPTIHIIDTAKGSSLAVFEIGQDMNDLVFSPDGTLIAVAGQDGATILIRAVVPATEIELKQAENIELVAFSPDGRLLVTASSLDSHFGVEDRVTDLRTKKEIAAYEGGGATTAVSFNRLGDRLALGTIDGTVVVLDTEGRELLRQDFAGEEIIAFDPDLGVLASQKDGTLSLAELATGDRLFQIDQIQHATHAVFSRNGALFAVGGWDGNARLIDVKNRIELARFEHGDYVTQLAFSPDGAKLATGSFDHHLRVFDTTTHKILLDLESNDRVVLPTFSPDGRILAAADLRVLHVLNVDTGATLARLEHDSNLTGIAFSPDGRWIATADADAKVHLLDVASGRELARLEHPEMLNAISFSPDGGLLATAGMDGVARLWSTDVERTIDGLCQREGRNLSLVEWRQFVGDVPWRPTCTDWAVPDDVRDAGLWPVEEKESSWIEWVASPVR